MNGSPCEGGRRSPQRTTSHEKVAGETISPRDLPYGQAANAKRKSLKSFAGGEAWARRAGRSTATSYAAAPNAGLIRGLVSLVAAATSGPCSPCIPRWPRRRRFAHERLKLEYATVSRARRPVASSKSRRNLLASV